VQQAPNRAVRPGSKSFAHYGCSGHCYPLVGDQPSASTETNEMGSTSGRLPQAKNRGRDRGSVAQNGKHDA
jgi:hypothetical protein